MDKTIFTVVKNIKGNVSSQIFITLLHQTLRCTTVCLKTEAENASMPPRQELLSLIRLASRG